MRSSPTGPPVRPSLPSRRTEVVRPKCQGATIPSSQIQIKGTQGSAGGLTVPVNLNFTSPLVVTANQNSAVDFEFDLAHPAFLVEHLAPGALAPVWVVNFNGPVRHHRIDDITALVLRHLYGSVTGVASNNSSISINREFPTEPPVNPETAVPSSLSVNILADATNGTIFYDLDAKTVSTIKDFSSVAGTINGKNVRVAALYQQDGTLVGVRIWASSTFNSVWVSPEGCTWIEPTASSRSKTRTASEFP